MYASEPTCSLLRLHDAGTLTVNLEGGKRRSEKVAICSAAGSTVEVQPQTVVKAIGSPTHQELWGFGGVCPNHG